MKKVRIISPLGKMGLILIGFLVCTGLNAQVKKCPILKSEMEKSTFQEYVIVCPDNNKFVDRWLHKPVLFSIDSNDKHLTIEMNNPDNNQIFVMVRDNNNQPIFFKNYKCKPSIKINTRKLDSDIFKVYVYHQQGRMLLASQDIYLSRAY